MEKLLRSEEIEVKPLQYADTVKATHTIEAANEDDPVERYIYNGAPNFWERYVRRLNYLSFFCVVAPLRIGYTIGHGDAIVFGVAPGTPSLGQGMSCVLGVLWAISNACMKLRSKEAVKRHEEVKTKTDAAFEAAFGDKRVDMMEVNSLYTHPSKQRRGYGTALVRSVTDKADAIRSPTYLCSTNINNTEFYEQCGFVTVAEFTVGENNSSWRGPPVVQRVMLRKVPDYRDENVL